MQNVKNHVLVAFALINISLFNQLGLPYQDNQLQYSFYSLRSKYSYWNTDPLYSTKDPFPIFTSIHTFLINFFGLGGLIFLSFLLTFIGIWAIYRFNFTILLNGTSKFSALILTTIIASPFLTSLFYPESGDENLVTSVIREASVFWGLGGSFLISKPSFLQPSSFGTLILAAIVVAFDYFQNPTKLKFLLSILSMIVALLIHPGYVGSIIILIPILIFAYYKNKFNALLFSHLIVLLFFICWTVVSKFEFVTQNYHESTSSDSIVRFAFERISHHTLITEWPITDRFYILIYLVAIMLLFRESKILAAAVLVMVLLQIAIAAIIVLHFKIPYIALAMPWRLSAILNPLIFAYLIFKILTFLRFKKLIIEKSRTWSLSLFLSLLFLLHSQFTNIREQSHQLKEKVFLQQDLIVNQDGTIGIGLIPPEWQNERILSKVPIYVDNKLAPYASKADLEKWWDRLDHTKRFYENYWYFCSNQEVFRVSWIVVSRLQKLPTCLSSWEKFNLNAKYSIIRKS